MGYSDAAVAHAAFLLKPSVVAGSLGGEMAESMLCARIHSVALGAQDTPGVSTLVDVPFADWLAWVREWRHGMEALPPERWESAYGTAVAVAKLFYWREPDAMAKLNDAFPPRRQ